MSDATIKLVVMVIGVICTLGIYSILYRENKVFRFFEHLYLGLAAGYAISTTWNDVLKPQWWTPMVQEGRWWFALALPGGLLFYMVYSKRHAWMSRLIFGLFFGATAGQTFQAFAADYFPKLNGVAGKALMVKPELASAPGNYALSPYSAALNNLLYMLILASVMTYFFFSFEQKGKAIQTVSRFGRYTLMVAFGALFGSTIMARMSLLIGRMYFILHDFVIVNLLHKS